MGNAHVEDEFPPDRVKVKVQGGSSYQIKRVMDIIESEKGLEMMSRSDILVNHGHGAKLSQFATFKDLKYQKKADQMQNRKHKYRRKY